MLKEYERFPQWLVDVEEGKIYNLKLKIIIGTIDKKGYVHVKPPKGYKHCKLHQYIWMCVNGDIPEGYDIHHKDHNKLNNSIYNLELVERHVHISEHKIGKHHSDETKRKMSKANVNNPKLSKQVVQYTLEGELVKIWDSTNECGRNGFSQGNVSACCQGKIKTHKKFKWRYYNEN